MKIVQLKEHDILYRDIESRIDSIKNKRNKYLVSHKFFRGLVFLAGAIITILTGWKGVLFPQLNTDNTILLISSSITLIAAYDGLF